MGCAGVMRPETKVRTRRSMIAGNGGGEKGVFLRMMEGRAAADADPKVVMIDATYLKPHRTASSLRVKRGISGA